MIFFVKCVATVQTNQVPGINSVFIAGAGLPGSGGRFCRGLGVGRVRAWR